MSVVEKDVKEVLRLACNNSKLHIAGTLPERCMIWVCRHPSLRACLTAGGDLLESTLHSRPVQLLSVQAQSLLLHYLRDCTCTDFCTDKVGKRCIICDSICKPADYVHRLAWPWPVCLLAILLLLPCIIAAFGPA